MKNSIKLFVFLNIFWTLSSLAAEINIEIQQMQPSIDTYNAAVAHNSDDLLEHSILLQATTLTTSDLNQVNNFLIENKNFIESLIKKSSSINEAINVTESILDMAKEANLNVELSNSSVRIFIPQNQKFSIVFGNPYIRFLNLAEKEGCYAKTLTDTQENIIDNEISKMDTFQHTSRFHLFEMVQKAKLEKNLSLVYTPTTYLIKVPWNSENRVADDNCIILEQTANNTVLVDNKFTSSMDYEQVRQIYEAVKTAGIWNIKNNWYTDNNGNMYILNMQQQSKTSPANFMNPLDPLLDRREGIKSLASYFPIQSEQFQYLIAAIKNDQDLYTISTRDNTQTSKKFMQTLINKAYEAHSQEK